MGLVVGRGPFVLRIDHEHYGSQRFRMLEDFTHCIEHQVFAQALMLVGTVNGEPSEEGGRNVGITR